MPRVNNPIPDEFPMFKDWPEFKIDFMTKLSSIIAENAEEIREEVEEEYINTHEDKFVIASDRLYTYNSDGKCYVCTENINLEYNSELEEWIYTDCELENDKYVIHEICMRYK